MMDAARVSGTLVNFYQTTRSTTQKTTTFVLTAARITYSTFKRGLYLLCQNFVKFIEARTIFFIIYSRNKYLSTCFTYTTKHCLLIWDPQKLLATSQTFSKHIIKVPWSCHEYALIKAYLEGKQPGNELESCTATVVHET